MSQNRSLETVRLLSRSCDRSTHRFPLLAILGVLFWLGAEVALAVPCAGQSTRGQPDYTGGTLQVIDHYLKGEYDIVCAYFSDEIAEQVRPQDLGKGWKYVESVAGTFQGLGEPTVSIKDKLHIVRVPAHFQRQEWVVVATWDAEGALSGFLLQPATETPRPPDSGTSSTKEAKADKAAHLQDAKMEPELRSESGDAHPELPGHWEGKIELPGSALILKMDLEWKNQQWSGTFASPMQGEESYLLSGIHVTGTEVAFSIDGIPGNPSFRGNHEAGVIKGTFSQSGQTFPCSFSRGPVHPQEPKRPYPYKDETVTYMSGDVKLEGTLTLPPGAGPFPAALLLSGSGAQDRDETLLGHKPFLVLSDFLTRAGIAVLRVDDRGVGGSTGGASMATTEEFVDDALAGTAFLQTRAEIDPKRIGLIGHSEGGIIAPMAAARSDHVAFIIMLAGSGVPGYEIILRQMELIARAEGTDPDTLQLALAAERKVLDLVKSGASGDEIQRQVRQLIEIQLSGTGELASLSAEERAAAADAQTAQATAQIMMPWVRFFLSHDPRPALQKVRVPVLALIGERDLQVDPKQNLPEIRKALEAGGNPDATVRELAGLNHLLQAAETGSPTEYAAIAETMNPMALETIRDWILSRFASK